MIKMNSSIGVDKLFTLRISGHHFGRIKKFPHPFNIREFFSNVFKNFR